MTNQDLEMVAGSSWLMSITIKHEQTSLMQANGGGGFTLVTTTVPLNLSAATDIEFCVKKTSLHAAPKLIFKQFGSGVVKIDNGINGVIQVHLEPVDTVKLVPGTYEYDLWILISNGRVPALRGKLQIVGAVNTDV